MAATTLRQVMVSSEQMHGFIGSVFRHRFCIGMAIAIWAFTSVLAPGDRYQEMTLFLRAFVNAVAALGFYGLGYLFSARVQYFLMLRGIPFFWGAVIFYSALAAGESLIFFSLLPADAGLNTALLYWATTVAMIMLTLAVLVMFFDQPIRKNLSRSPDDFPMWRPFKAGFSSLELELPADIRAPVQRIEAENQYIRVTTAKGDTMLRMSLTQAENLLEPGLGFRVHRSMWIRKSRIADLVFRDGNPKIRCADENEYPISRARVADIREYLSGVSQ